MGYASDVDATTSSQVADPVLRAAQLVFLIRIFVVVLVFDPESFSTFSVAKSAVAHVTTAILAALLAWLLIRRGRRLLVWSPLHIGAGAVLLSFALATPLALDRNVALFGAWQRGLGLTQMIDYIVLYAAAAMLLRSSRVLSWLAMAAGATTIVVVLYGLLQLFGMDPVTYGSARPGLTSTLGNADLVGGYVSVMTVTAFGVLVLLWQQLSVPARVASITLVAGGLALLLLAAVRNGLVGVVAGLCAIGLLLVVRPGRRGRALALTFASVPIIALAIALSPLGARLTPDLLRGDLAIQERLEIYRTTARLVAARPILGLGPDNFAVGYPSFREASSFALNGPDRLQTSTHDWALYYLTSAGVVGLVAFLATIVLALRVSLLLTRRSDVGGIVLVPLAAYLGQGLANVDDVATGWIPWVAFGVLAASTGVTTVPARRAVADRVRRRGFGVGLVALTVVAAVATMSALPLFSASRSMSRTEALIVKGSVADAVASGVEAVRSDERRPEYWSSLGSSLVRTNPTAAASAFIAAATRAPWHPLYWRNLALVYGNSGNRRGAIVAARRAIAADRSDAEAHRLLANLLFDNGDFSGAAAEGEVAIGLYPAAEGYDANFNVVRTPGEQAYDITALAYIRLGRWDDAVRVVRTGMTFTHNAVLIRLRYAQAYAGGGKFDSAREQLAIVLAEDPTNREALDLRDFLASK